MATLAQLNLPPILQTHYLALSTHPDSLLKEYYGNPDVQARIRVIYISALKQTVPKTAAGGTVLALSAAWLTGLGMLGIFTSSLGGLLGGAAAGITYETVNLAIHIRVDEGYINWKKSITKPILDDFEAVVNQHEPFENFLCVITHDFPSIPVRDSDGRLYDQDAIFEWIDKNETNPCTRLPMKREDVTFCPKFAVELSNEMVDAYGHRGVAKLVNKHPDEIISGLQAILCSIITNHNTIILKRALDEQNAALRQGLPAAEVNRIYRNITDGNILDIPQIRKPTGLSAILTIERIGDVNDSLLPTVGTAISEVATDLLSKPHKD